MCWLWLVIAVGFIDFNLKQELLSPISALQLPGFIDLKLKQELLHHSDAKEAIRHCISLVLRFNVPVNNFSVMSGRTFGFVDLKL